MAFLGSVITSGLTASAHKATIRGQNRAGSRILSPSAPPVPYREPTYYEASAGPATRYPPLLGDARADVAIVGAGFTGLTAALHLAAAGFTVIVLEAQEVGSGGSGRNGGLMVPGQRRDQLYLEQRLGQRTARGLFEMYLEARAHLLGLIETHQIDCDLQQGFLHAAHKARYVGELRNYAEHLVKHYEYGSVRILDRAEAAKEIGTDAYFGAYADANGGHLHPLKLVRGIARAATDAGARICEQSPVVAVEGDHKRPAVRTASGRIEAAFVVIATDAYSAGLSAGLDRHVLPIDAYVIATAPLGDTLRRTILPKRPSVSDTRFVVNYFRVTRDDRLIFGGGETYGLGRPTDIASFVRYPLVQVFPQLAGIPIDFGWSGKIAITMNRMPYIRRPSRNVLISAGTCGQGVVLAPYYGRILSDAVKGTLERFDRLAGFEVPAFPGGRTLRAPIMMAGMTYYALRDRI